MTPPDQHTPAGWVEADPFDLPEWLGTTTVTWCSSSPLRAAARVVGELVAGGPLGEPLTVTRSGGDNPRPAPLGCDLLAVDEAYPAPVADAELRRAAHQAWRRDEVFLANVHERLVLAVPGSGFDADRALDAVARLAKAVGAAPAAYAVCLKVGRDSS